jgi:hypothetical protein
MAILISFGRILKFKNKLYAFIPRLELLCCGDLVKDIRRIIDRERYPKNNGQLLNPSGSGRRGPVLRPVAPIAIHI